MYNNKLRKAKQIKRWKIRKLMVKRTKNKKIWYEDLKYKYTILGRVTVKQILIIFLLKW